MSDIHREERPTTNRLEKADHSTKASTFAMRTTVLSTSDGTIDLVVDKGGSAKAVRFKVVERLAT